MSAPPLFLALSLPKVLDAVCKKNNIKELIVKEERGHEHEEVYAIAPPPGGGGQSMKTAPSLMGDSTYVRAANLLIQ